VKLAVVAPPGTVTDAGTVRAEVALLVSETAAPPVGAGFEMVIVQDVDPEAASVVAAHCSEEIETGAMRETVSEAEPPLRRPVMIAV